MSHDSPASPPGYGAAINQAAFYIQSEAGYLRISGEDRQGFLQRQSTNDLGLLSSERVVTTVLTSATARILDVLTLVEEPEAIGAITSTGRADATTRFLRSKIFFNDKVSVEDASSQIAQIDLTGPEASQVLKLIGLSRVPSGDEPVAEEISAIQVRALIQHGLGYRLLVPAESLELMKTHLKDAGAAELAPEGYAVLRVEMGLPETGHELTEDYTPLETGLEWTISGEKGCYTGQEVIARQLTYDKVTRQLVGLELTGEVETGARVSPVGESRTIGEISSTVRSPRFEHIALAVLRKPYHEPGTEVMIGDGDKSIRATVADLPFKM